ncbi:histidinol-phosphate transaminase [Flavobacterium kingsejongi]|uniref:Histidinol-phosphate aminotransferase n=1 Tax=Flavobacterium kingsejongi TaxID=1678728 RepID=A0A2S1LTK2_9FLAO|nr:histidinol-phosphate transaminase [Flavobacterium kingsejongi]AWG27069.1 histidinol-phosphate transaminase [Flavobacterium kingsejongi]
MFDLKKIVRPTILSLEPYSSARNEYTGTAGVFLDANENPFGTWNRYPDPNQQKLREKIAQVKSVTTDSVFLGNGSDEIIDLCFRIFCEPGKDKALTFTPTYGMYEVSAAINTVTLLELPLNEAFQIDEAAVLPLLQTENLKLVFLCSPNNPTGNTLEGIDFILAHFNGIVIVDEAYIDFSNRPSYSQKINQYPNLIVLQTLSKAWGMAALRIGIALAQPELLSLLNRIKPPYNISSPAQQIALEALEATALFETQKQLLITEREKMTEALQQSPIIRKVYPSEGNFILVTVSDADRVYKQLTDTNLIVRNRNTVIRNCLRITIGTPEENVLLLAALQNIKS